MLGKAAAVMALTASCLLTGVPLGLAGSKSSPGTTPQAGWYDADSNAAHSRANLAEKVLTPSAVTKVRYLRSVVAPQTRSPCGPGRIAAPLPFGGFLYAVTNSGVTKYNPATGRLIWRSKLSRYYIYNSLAISGNLVIVGGPGCQSASQPGGIIYALNASTGARVWSSGNGGATISDVVKVGSYVITVGSDAAGYEASVLNLSDGTSAWHMFGCLYVSSPPALVVGLVVMTYGCDSQGRSDIQARNLATGALEWSLPVGWTLQRGDLSGAAGKHLYATDPAGTVRGLNPQTGQAEYSLSQAHRVLAVDASRVYAACGPRGFDVCGYNISTGAPEWQVTYPRPLTVSPTLAAEADGVLYLDTGVALNAATGKVIRRLWPAIHATALAVGDGRIGVVSEPRVLDLYGLPGS